MSDAVESELASPRWSIACREAVPHFRAERDDGAEMSAEVLVVEVARGAQMPVLYATVRVVLALYSSVQRLTFHVDNPFLVMEILFPGLRPGGSPRDVARQLCAIENAGEERFFAHVLECSDSESAALTVSVYAFLRSRRDSPRAAACAKKVRDDAASMQVYTGAPHIGFGKYFDDECVDDAEAPEEDRDTDDAVPVAMPKMYALPPEMLAAKHVQDRRAWENISTWDEVVSRPSLHEELNMALVFICVRSQGMIPALVRRGDAAASTNDNPDLYVDFMNCNLHSSAQRSAPLMDVLNRHGSSLYVAHGCKGLCRGLVCASKHAGQAALREFQRILPETVHAAFRRQKANASKRAGGGGGGKDTAVCEDALGVAIEPRHALGVNVIPLLARVMLLAHPCDWAMLAEAMRGFAADLFAARLAPPACLDGRNNADADHLKFGLRETLRILNRRSTESHEAGEEAARRQSARAFLERASATAEKTYQHVGGAIMSPSSAAKRARVSSALDQMYPMHANGVQHERVLEIIGEAVNGTLVACGADGDEVTYARVTSMLVQRYLGGVRVADCEEDDMTPAMLRRVGGVNEMTRPNGPCAGRRCARGTAYALQLRGAPPPHTPEEGNPSTTTATATSNASWFFGVDAWVTAAVLCTVAVAVPAAQNVLAGPVGSAAAQRADAACSVYGAVHTMSADRNGYAALRACDVNALCTLACASFAFEPSPRHTPCCGDPVQSLLAFPRHLRFVAPHTRTRPHARCWVDLLRWPAVCIALDIARDGGNE